MKQKFGKYISVFIRFREFVKLTWVIYIIIHIKLTSPLNLMKTGRSRSRYSCQNLLRCLSSFRLGFPDLTKQELCTGFAKTFFRDGKGLWNVVIIQFCVSLKHFVGSFFGLYCFSLPMLLIIRGFFTKTNNRSTHWTLISYLLQIM